MAKFAFPPLGKRRPGRILFYPDFFEIVTRNQVAKLHCRLQISK
jgi:hypothetical protein